MWCGLAYSGFRGIGLEKSKNVLEKNEVRSGLFRFRCQVRSSELEVVIMALVNRGSDELRILAADQGRKCTHASEDVVADLIHYKLQNCRPEA